MRNIKVVDFSYGRRSSDDVNTSLPFTDNYKETKTIQQANVVIASYINESIKDIAEVNSNLDDLVVEVESKQDELISGENIKTINGESILGSGDISVVSDFSWGDITGDIDDQIDLKNALDEKQDELISGENIKTINGESILGSGDISVVSDFSWGDITGDIDDQTDLKNALADKQDTLIGTEITGQNIKTINNESILGEGNIDVQSTITGAATSITKNNLTANRILISNSNKKVAASSVTITDLTRMKNASIYSTEEHIVGTWIDGKPIYRKVFTFVSLENSSDNVVGSINDLSSLVAINGWSNIGGELYSLPHSDYRNIEWNIGLVFHFVNKNVVVRKGAYGSIGGDSCVIVEYTKTTD